VQKSAQLGRAKRSSPFNWALYFMKKVAFGLLVVILLVSIPTLVVSESIVLVRAVAQKNVYRDITDYLVPRFLAKTRIAIYGLTECTDVLEGEKEPHNLVNFLAAAHAEDGNDKALIKKYLSTLHGNGCSLDAVDLGGLPALHGSILYNDFELVKYFVEKGANVNGKILRPGKKSHNKNALEFTYLLIDVEPDVNRDDIIELLNGTI